VNEPPKFPGFGTGTGTHNPAADGTVNNPERIIHAAHATTVDSASQPGNAAKIKRNRIVGTSTDSDFIEALSEFEQIISDHKERGELLAELAIRAATALHTQSQALAILQSMQRQHLPSANAVIDHNESPTIVAPNQVQQSPSPMSQFVSDGDSSALIQSAIGLATRHKIASAAIAAIMAMAYASPNIKSALMPIISQHTKPEKNNE
jgi:hypothetical protein